jgi:1-aminocyclopropane-1-carboxylate deaminase
LRDTNCRYLLHYIQTPVQELHHILFDKAGVRVLIKREDLNHPLVSGNKWWKLKYNLAEARNKEKKTLLTFGGAYSNHIFATAAAAHELGFESIGIIRGEETLPLNRTLRFASDQGMQLHYVSRELYRKKNEAEFKEELHKQFGDFYLIPEGGTNKLAVKGVTKFAQSFDNDFDYLCCAVGTGGTMAGLINGTNSDKTILGFPVLKGGEFLKAEIEKLLDTERYNWKLVTDYHFGGYAKSNSALLEFIKQFEKDFKIPLEHIYTGKMFFGLFDLIENGYFRRGSVIFAIHSGGLQLIP